MRLSTLLPGTACKPRLRPSPSLTAAHPSSRRCVLYSEIDNVTSINKGWDVGSGVGWNLSYPYLQDGAIPPTGIRSAVPLGGMGTGNFELRGDGTFRQWCIESQSPGGGAKLDIGALDDAVLVSSQAAPAVAWLYAHFDRLLVMTQGVKIGGKAVRFPVHFCDF